MVVPAGVIRKFSRIADGGRRFALCALVLGNPGFLSGQTPVAALHPAANTPGTSTSWAVPPTAFPECVISPDDILAINVYDAPDVTGEYRVSPNGQIMIPLLDASILAAGRTAAQLAEAIGDSYRRAEIYTHPRVTVAIKESRVHAIAIAGAVKKPQIYPVFGKTTLLDLLSQAEGLADDAGGLAMISRGDVAMQVLKTAGGCNSPEIRASCDSTFGVDLNRLSETGDPQLNVDLYPGDRVTVQRAGIVYVVGAVNRPGGFPLRTGQEKMTVIQALALAEDLKSTAAQKRAMIIRKNPATGGGREQIPVNLSKVLDGHEHDLQLQANDILFVPDSAGKRALRRSGEAAITAATWGLVYHY